MELSNSKIKKFIIFLKKAFPTFQLKPHPSPLPLKKKFRPKKKFLIFREMELSNSKIKKIQETETPKKKIPYISGNGSPKKTSYISGNGTFQYTPKKFLIFQECKP